MRLFAAFANRAAFLVRMCLGQLSFDVGDTRTAVVRDSSYADLHLSGGG